jgi:putative DNA primase/helicase
MVARLAAVTSDILVDYLSQTVEFTKSDGRSKKRKRTNPPRQMAVTILSRDGERKFNSLAGVITTPTLRPDGSILATPGYDSATRLFLAKPPPMPPILDAPSKQDAKAALELLEGLLREFPFEGPASKAVALSALITPVVRGAMPVAPLHVFSAPAPGTGKSFLADLASAIATGQLCPALAAGRDETETEKRLGAAVLAGQPIISIDNLNGDLQGDAFCQFVERPIVEVRPLGVSELVRIESRATLFATGNNIYLKGDMVRRAIVCSLDANSERPELRRFEHDPVATVLLDRGKFVAAALTIARAYLAAGKPGRCAPLNSFAPWSDLVRSSLVWLGQADPVETMESARAEDPETSQLQEFVAAWREELGPGPRTVAELVHGAESGQGGLREALKAFTGGGERVDSRKVGKWLSRNKGRIVDGTKIVGARCAHIKQVRWELQETSSLRVLRVSAGIPLSNARENASAFNISMSGNIPANTAYTRKPSPFAVKTGSAPSDKLSTFPREFSGKPLAGEDDGDKVEQDADGPNAG